MEPFIEMIGKTQMTRQGYMRIHGWLKYRYPAPTTCQHCHEEKKLDLANSTGEYTKNINDYLWLCRTCHIAYDKKLGRRLK